MRSASPHLFKIDMPCHPVEIRHIVIGAHKKRNASLLAAVAKTNDGSYRKATFKVIITFCT